MMFSVVSSTTVSCILFLLFFFSMEDLNFFFKALIANLLQYLGFIWSNITNVIVTIEKV